MENVFFEVTLECLLKENKQFIETEISEKLTYLLEQIDKCLEWELDGDIVDTLKIGIVKSIMTTIKEPVEKIFQRLTDEAENERLENEFNQDNEDTINFAWQQAKGINNLW